MAKLVDCKQTEVEGVLAAHAEQWVLVAVIRYQYSPGLRDPEEEWRELYFEKAAR